MKAGQLVVWGSRRAPTPPPDGPAGSAESARPGVGVLPSDVVRPVVARQRDLAVQRATIGGARPYLPPHQRPADEMAEVHGEDLFLACACDLAVRRAGQRVVEVTAHRFLRTMLFLASVSFAPAPKVVVDDFYMAT